MPSLHLPAGLRRLGFSRSLHRDVQLLQHFAAILRDPAGTFGEDAER
jgi:hypothetical protein